MDGVLILCICSIFVAIAIGFAFGINIGMVGIVFAILIGHFGLGLSVSKMVGFWPTSLLYIMIFVTCFYGFAKQNGTMDVLGKKLLRLMRGRAALLVPVVMLSGIVLGFANASLSLILGPLIFAIGLSCGQNPLMLCLVTCVAYNLGVDNPWTGTGGIVATNLMLEAGFTNAPVMAIGIYANTFLKNCLICLSVYLIYKGYKGGKVEMIEAPAFNPVQKKTFIIIVTSLLMLLIPPFLLMFFPQSAFIKTLKTILCIQLIMPAAICVASILKLGEMKNAVKNIPMNTVLLIGGMSILMGVCKEAGLNNAFAAFLGGNLPHWAVKFTLCIAAAFLSFFSGGVSVVVPMLFPLVPQLAATGGFNPTVLYSIIFVGAMSSSCSPFSSGGAQVLSIIPDPEIQNNLTMKMAGFAVGFSIIFSLLSAVGLWDIIPALMGNINY